MSRYRRLKRVIRRRRAARSTYRRRRSRVRRNRLSRQPRPGKIGYRL